LLYTISDQADDICISFELSTEEKKELERKLEREIRKPFHRKKSYLQTSEIQLKEPARG